MTTYEDVQLEINRKLELLAKTARRLQSLASVDGMGKDTARASAYKSANDFFEFLTEEYIPHRCYNLSQDKFRTEDGILLKNIEAAGAFIDKYIPGVDDSAKERRRQVMRYACGILSDKIENNSIKLAEKLEIFRLIPEIRNYENGLAPNFLSLENVENFFKTIGTIKEYSSLYLKESSLYASWMSGAGASNVKLRPEHFENDDSVLPSDQEKPQDSVIPDHESRLRRVSQNHEIQQFLQRWGGPSQADGMRAYAREVPKGAPQSVETTTRLADSQAHTQNSNPGTATSSLAVKFSPVEAAVSGSTRKRGRENGDKVASPDDPSGKRRKLIDDRRSRDPSTARDM